LLINPADSQMTASEPLTFICRNEGMPTKHTDLVLGGSFIITSTALFTSWSYPLIS